MTFQTLLDVAVAGTRRADPPAILPELATAGAERRLLRGAAYAGLRRLAGYVPEPAPRPIPTPSPLDTLPEVPAAAAARLPEILNEYPELLPEWLGCARARGLRAPFVLLPRLIEHVRAHPELLDQLASVGGRRLAWLAARNPAWRFAAASDPVESFETGARVERARALRTIRAGDPARGRALLEASWGGESPEARETLLESLMEGLSADDEGLLERGLRDPRKEVREVALRLLRRIPASSFAQRWAGRARELVHVRRRLRGTRVEIRQIDSFDPSWAHDGAEQRVPKGMNRTGWWLQQLLAFTPPDVWPSGILPALLASEWPDPLVAGLAQAAAAYRHTPWSAELIAAWAEAKDQRRRLPFDGAALLASLPPDQAEASLRRALDVDPATGPLLAAAWPHPWSQEFSLFFAQRLPVFRPLWGYAGRAPLAQAAFQLDPAVLPEIRQLLEREQENAWDRHVLERMVATVSYRGALRRDFQ